MPRYPLKQRDDLWLKRTDGGTNRYSILLDKHVLATVVRGSSSDEEQSHVVVVELDSSRYYIQGNLYFLPLPASSASPASRSTSRSSSSSASPASRSRSIEEDVRLLDQTLYESTSAASAAYARSPISAIEEALEDLELDEYLIVVIPFTLDKMKKMFAVVDNLDRRVKRACPELRLHLTTMRSLRIDCGGSHDLSFITPNYENEHLLYVSSGNAPVSSVRFIAQNVGSDAYDYEIHSNTRHDFERFRYNQFLRLAAYLLIENAFKKGTVRSTAVNPISMYSMHKLFFGTTLPKATCAEMVANKEPISVNIDQETTRRVNKWLRVMLRRGKRGISCTPATLSRILRSARATHKLRG